MYICTNFIIHTRQQLCSSRAVQRISMATRRPARARDRDFVPSLQANRCNDREAEASSRNSVRVRCRVCLGTLKDYSRRQSGQAC
jgi:hypothetical protein